MKSIALVFTFFMASQSVFAASETSAKAPDFVYSGRCMVDNLVSNGNDSVTYAAVNVSLKDHESRVIYSSNGLNYKVSVFSLRGTEPLEYVLELDVLQDGKALPAGVVAASHTSFTDVPPSEVGTYAGSSNVINCVRL